MQSMTVAEIKESLGVEKAPGDEEISVTGICTDTRKITPGDLFIPLRGENFDGHQFIAEALKAGSAAALSSLQSIEGVDKTSLIVVDDTLTAYHRLASAYRKSLKVPLVAITGSNGKTTTKDLVAEILSQRYKVLKTPENFNNEIGVPQTILTVEPSVERVVLEMAMRGRGQIRQLCEIARPDVGIITTIGESHFELLGSYQAIADAKGELLESIHHTGFAVLNADDRWFTYLVEKCQCPVYSYGQSEEAYLRLLECRPVEMEGFDITVKKGLTDTHSFRIPMLGFHNVYNSLAAILIGFLDGLKESEIQKGLSSVKITGKRMEKLITDDGIIIINDTYNASPTSVRQALKTLSMTNMNGRRVAVLGDMRELGDIAEKGHRETGQEVFHSKIDHLITLGDMGRWIHEEAVSQGMAPDKCLWFEDRFNAMEYVSGLLVEGDVVLVKASRLMKLEEVVEHIKSSHGYTAVKNS